MTFGSHAPRSSQCKVCLKPYLVLRMGQKVCSVRCATKLAKAVRAKGRKELRERKKELQTIPELIKVAQREFNAYIRARDKDQPCICCGQPLCGSDASASTGGAFDCGHYRSTGSAPHLRFDERNAHGQRKVCNRWGAGRAVDYRIGLIARVGLEAVEALEADNTIRKWTREELREIAATYRAKRKELEKQL